MSVPLGIFGPRIIDLAHRLAEFSDSPDGLSCTFMTPAHRAAAARLAEWMAAAGMAARIDALGNVVGVYAGTGARPGAVLIGSHYDTVIDAGSFDGRLGILTGLVAVEHLHRMGRRLPFDIVVIGFSEEEGVRFSAPYIGSSAIAGRFDFRLLERRDAAGVSLGEVISRNGYNPEDIPSLAFPADRLLAYLEVHIEQGPVLLDEGLPVGVVTSIAGAARFSVTVEGRAGHAGTVPMGLRRDAAAAAAEIILYVERRCSGQPGLVGTVGRLHVPGGAVNVIPGRCEFSMDIRAETDAARDAAIADILAEIAAVARRRGVRIVPQEMQRAPAVACSPRIQALFSDAVSRLGVPPRSLPSGAGHDAVQFGGLTELGMLFVRCGNGGISHSPRETVTAEDADAGARVLLDVLEHL